MTISSGSTSVTRFLAAGFLLSSIIFSGCSDSGTGAGSAGDTTDPTISLSASSNLVLADGNVVYTATASDNEEVTLVEFYDGSLMIGSDDTAPFEFTAGYTETDNGAHSPWAKAEDAAGNSGESDTLSVIVAINVTAEFVNPGFTDDATGWTLHNFDPWHGWTGDAGNPPGCFRLNEFGACNVDPGIQQEVSGFIPGVTYEITGDYRPFYLPLSNEFAEAFAVTVDSVVVGSFAWGVNGTEWSPFVAEFTATDFTHTIGFWGEYNCYDYAFEVDNVLLSIKAGI